MDLAAWQRGDRAALADAVAEIIPAAWALARAGFVLPGPPRDRILGVERDADAERVVAHALADALAPERRGEPGPAWRARALAGLRDALAGFADAHGGRVTLGEGDDGDETDALGVDAQARAEALASAAAALALDDVDRRIVASRWGAGASREATAAAVGTSPRRVAARERAVRQRLQRQAGRRAGEVELDLALAGETRRFTVPAPSRERLVHAVLTRVDPTPQRSAGARWAWATAALAPGLALAALMFAGILPGPDGDRALTPSIALRCPGERCAPGDAARVHVVAPRGARRVAVGIVDAEGHALSWRSMPVPSSARWREAALSRSLAVPEASGPLRAVAVFSKRRVDRADLERAAAGEPPEGSLTAWAPLTAK